MKPLVETWNPIPGLYEYILHTWRGEGRVEEVFDDSKERLAFVNRAKQSFGSNAFKVRRLRTWLNVMLPSDASGYDKGYPHVHNNTAAMTLVHYVDVGDKPPALDLFEGDDVVETITPQSNQTIYIPNGVKHGVHKNNGSLPRVAMISTAYP